MSEVENDVISRETANGFEVTVFKGGQIDVTNTHAKPGELQSVSAFPDGNRAGYIATANNGIDLAPAGTDLSQMTHGHTVVEIDPKLLHVEVKHDGITIYKVDETRTVETRQTQKAESPPIFSETANGFQVTALEGGRIMVSNTHANTPGELQSVDLFPDGTRTGYVLTENGGVALAPAGMDLTKMTHGHTVVNIDPEKLKVQVLHDGKEILGLDRTVKTETQRSNDPARFEEMLQGLDKSVLDKIALNPSDREHTNTAEKSNAKSGGRPR